MTAPSQSPLADLAASQGAPVYLGTIDATTISATNSQASTPFNNSGDGLAGKNLLIYNAGSVEISVYPVVASTDAVTRTRAAGAKYGVPVAAGGKVTMRLGPGTPYLAAITASSTANVDVWELV